MKYTNVAGNTVNSKNIIFKIILMKLGNVFIAKNLFHFHFQRMYFEICLFWSYSAFIVFTLEGGK